MKNTATFNAKTKKIILKFREEYFEVDLAEGDLHDSWNGITLKTGEVFDFNFSWEEECKPAVSLYATYTQDNQLYTNHSDSYSFDIVEQIGSFEDYFGYKEGFYEIKEPVLESFTVNFTGNIIVDAQNQHEARQKVTLMEVNFNNTYVEQVL